MGRSFDSHPLVEGYGTSCRGAPELSYCLHNARYQILTDALDSADSKKGSLYAFDLWFYH